VRGLVVADVDRHQARKSLRHRIRARALGVRAILPEAADRQVDQARIIAGEILVADPEAGGDAGPKTFDEDIAISGQPFCNGDSLGVFQVEAQTALAAIVDGRQRRVTSVGCAEIARPVALRRFDLDDFGPVDTEQHRAIGRSDALAKIENTQAAIRRVVRRRHLAFDWQYGSPGPTCQEHGLIPA
jgi:hypothetical protein